MKKIVLISILFLFITTETLAKDVQNDEMLDLASFITSSNLSVENWQVTIKEEIDRVKIDDIVKELKNSHLVTMTKDENRIKYSFVNTNKSDDISESYSVIIPVNKVDNAELIAVIDGDFWNKEIKESYRLKLDSITEQYFTNAAKKFACLKAGNDGIMNSDYFLNEMIKQFNIQHIQTQYDNVANSMHKKIIYGYTPLWNKKISIADTPMNLQIAVTQHENENQTYTIGTPILVNEY